MHNLRYFQKSSWSWLVRISEETSMGIINGDGSDGWDTPNLEQYVVNNLKLYVLKNHHDVEVSSWEAFSLRSPATKLASLCFSSWFFCFGVAAFVQIFCQESNVQPVQLPVVCFVGIKFLGKFCWCHCDLDNVGCAARTDEDLWRHPWCRPKHCFSEFDPFLVTTSVCPPFLSTQNIGPKVNTSTCLSCSISVEKYQCLGPSSYQCTPSMFPKKIGEVMGPAMKEKNYIFMGDFVDRGRRFQKVEGSNWYLAIITGSDPWIWQNQDTTVSKLLSFWCSWSFDIRCLP